MAYTVGKGS